jgi:hypothetical protein
MMRKVWKKLAYGLITLGFVGGLSACTDFLDKAENTYPSTAEVLFYHASPNAPQLTITVEEKNFLDAPLGYAQYAGYKNFYTGNRHFKFRRSDNTSTLLDTTLSFSLNTSYSVFVINNNASIETLMTIDTAEVPSAGKAMVRFIHLSPDTNPVDVAIVGENKNIFTGLGYKHGSAFKQVDARTFKVVMKNSETDDEILTSNDMTLTAGHYYTIISRGFTNPPEGNTNTLTVQLVENE